MKKFALASLRIGPAETSSIAHAQRLAVRDAEDGAQGSVAFTQERTPHDNGGE